jgi:hypothetical protein
MSVPIARADQITPEWLTHTLRANGHLDRGRVIAIEQRVEPTVISVTAYLKVRYSEDAPATAPARLFLKTGQTDRPQHSGWERESRFYRELAPDLGDATARCYDVAYSTEPVAFHLLLEDLSETHTDTPDYPLPPTPRQFELAVDCLARVHARWWDHPRFTQDLRPYWTPAEFENWAEALPRYIDFLGARLLPERRAIYERAMPALLPLRQARLDAGRNLTLAHQDPHFWNFLFRRDGQGAALLIDWSAWDVTVGACDLAYLIGLHLFPADRARLEQPLLRRYHQRLLEEGVTGYDWDALWQDYRLQAIYNLFIPVSQWSYGLPRWLWWLHAERSMQTFQDLRCIELL